MIMIMLRVRLRVPDECDFFSYRHDRISTPSEVTTLDGGHTTNDGVGEITTPRHRNVG